MPTRRGSICPGTTPPAHSDPEGVPGMQRQMVQMEVAGAVLAADLMVPPAPVAMVVFAHGSGSSRLSPRNRQVAEELRAAGFATLLADLLTPDEERLDERTA